MRAAGTMVVMAASLAATAAVGAGAVARYDVVGDAIPAPLDGRSGEPARGRKLVLDRETGNCLICHHIADSGEPSQGDIGPSLSGVGGRLTVGQLRLRLVDQSRVNPHTIMPPYHRVEGLSRVAPRFRDRPVFTAQEVEDIVAWLATLQR